MADTPITLTPAPVPTTPEPVDARDPSEIHANVKGTVRSGMTVTKDE